MVSVPRHATLSRKILPVPAPKVVSVTAVASVSVTCRVKTLKLELSFGALTDGGVTKLSAHDTCIRLAPQVIAHGSPLLVRAEFHTTFVCTHASNQTDGTIDTA